MPRMNTAVAAAHAAAAARKPVENDGVTAVLGPTNTGKTHYAIERMLGHKTGVIGFPLRLLAREVYDRVVGMIGPREVGLITGEEKIMPPDARFVLSTVEAMPLDWGADFVAVDEIQLCADPERGHVFTNRLLNARGRVETLFLGAATMWDRIASLAPGARFITRERFSTLSYAGSKKISRLPPRTAIVAFSVDSVYAIAELLRRQKGGAAVVMGALSPRTRNAQVTLYQEGDVDYLVATDAIGMGLNMDVRHVAFAGLSKFDGRRVRRLHPNELAQIAGRAGRHMNDGTFGVTGEAAALDEEVVDSIENHRFSRVGRLQWRCAELEFATAQALIASLEREPSSEDLTKAREADDLATLRMLADDPTVADRAAGRGAVRKLWDVCQTPDFRKTLASEHAALLSEIYKFLTSDRGVVPEDWMARAVARVDRTDGDIDALSKRLAYVRTWTYVANRVDWLADPAHWRAATREIEDKVSDALHARLTQRFVDRRTSVLARRLKAKEKLVASIEADGAVTVEGEFVGKLDGFRFEPDPEAAGAEVKTLQAAGAQALAAELARRVEKFYNAPDGEIDITEQGGMMWGDAAVGRLERPEGAGADPLALRARAFADDLLDQTARDKIERRLQFWIDRKIAAAFEPLIALRDDPELQGIARGVAYQLVERAGVIPRHEIAADIRALEQADRALLRKHGVRFGQHTIFLPALLKPAPTRLRILISGLAAELDIIPSPPPPGHVTIPAEEGLSARFYTTAGYRLCGVRAIRLDMLERLADLIRPLDQREGFEATPEMLSITGATLDQFAEMMTALGFAAEKGERPKTAKPPAATRRKKKGAAPAAGPTTAPEAHVAQPTLIFSAPARAEGDPEAAQAPAEAQTEAAEAQAEAQTEAAEVPAEAQTEAAEVPAEAQTEAAQAPAEAQTEAAEVPAEAQTETAEVPAEAQTETAEAQPETADTQAEAQPDAADKPAELETFYIFRLAPRPRRRQEGEGRGPRRDDQNQEGRAERRGPRRGKGGGGQQQGGERREQEGGGPGKRGPRRGARPDNAASAGPRGGGPSGGDGPKGGKGGGRQGGRTEKKAADPDSPFAVLQRLKDKL